MKTGRPVRKFEDLVAWQKARTLTHDIYHVTSHGSFGKDYGLRDQIRRASVSIMSNIAEGFERAGRSEFHQFLSIAKGSCAELRSHLYVASDSEYLDHKRFSELLARAEEVARILGGLRASVQNQRDKSGPRASALPLSPQHSALSPQR